MHEIAWCKIIQLDFEQAKKRFDELRQISNFSKIFYTYMTAICQGAAGDFTNLYDIKLEITRLYATNKQKVKYAIDFN